MRRKLIAVGFIVLSLTSAGWAKNTHDWEQVEKLKPGTTILIALWNGRLIDGSVDAVGPSSLRMNTADPEVGVGSLEEFDRVNIRRIVHIRRPGMPEPERWMLIGALAGGAIGLTAGVIDDLSHHENYHWFTGGVGGAGVGFLASCTILAGWGVAELFHHHRTLVYEDPRGETMRPH